MGDKPRIGFIGAGYMGHGMASCFLDKGYPLTVLAHKKRDKIEDLLSRGAVELTSAAEMASQSDFIVLMVTGSEQVAEIVSGENGLASGVADKLTVIDCTTSDPNTIMRLAREYEDAGIEFVDSPVGRSPAEARTGKLAAFVGASEELMSRARPIINVYASDIFHIGPLGFGHKMKLVNNLVSISYCAMFSEVYTLASKVGLPVTAVHSVLSSTRMNNPFYQTFAEGIVNGNPNAHLFSIKNGLKDISCITSMANAAGNYSPIANSVQEVYAKVVEGGYGEEMMPALPQALGNLTDTALIDAKESLQGLKSES